MEISILYHVTVNNQLNRDKLERCYIKCFKRRVSETWCSSCNSPVDSGLLKQTVSMQCAQIQSSCSSWKKLNGGLPQGTKLGPLLFAILVNNLLKNWSGRIKFVDDTTAFEIIPRGSPSILPVVVDKMSNFASTRGTQTNQKKCKEMIIYFLKHNHVPVLLQVLSRGSLSKLYPLSVYYCLTTFLGELTLNVS